MAGYRTNRRSPRPWRRRTSAPAPGADTATGGTDQGTTAIRSGSAPSPSTSRPSTNRDGTVMRSARRTELGTIAPRYRRFTAEKLSGRSRGWVSCTASVTRPLAVSGITPPAWCTMSTPARATRRGRSTVSAATRRTLLPPAAPTGWNSKRSTSAGWASVSDGSPKTTTSMPAATARSPTAPSARVVASSLPPTTPGTSQARFTPTRRVTHRPRDRRPPSAQRTAPT